MPPLGGIVIPPPERARSGFKRDIADRLPETITLGSVDTIFAFVPEGVVERIAPRAALIIAADHDVVVPADHARRLYQRLKPPKRLVLLQGTSSYRARSTHADIMLNAIADWFDRYSTSPPALAWEELPA